MARPRAATGSSVPPPSSRYTRYVWAAKAPTSARSSACFLLGVTVMGHSGPPGPPLSIQRSAVPKLRAQTIGGTDERQRDWGAPTGSRGRASRRIQGIFNLGRGCWLLRSKPPSWSGGCHDGCPYRSSRRYRSLPRFRRTRGICTLGREIGVNAELPTPVPWPAMPTLIGDELRRRRLERQSPVTRS